MNFESLFTVPFGDLIFYFIAFILSLSVHESAHALTSDWFGDDTGRLQGRISLNPAVHIDPIGTLLIPFVGFLQAASGVPLIGWAKPVDVNPLRWRNKDLANITVSAAGPISNLLLALLALITTKVLMWRGLIQPGYQRPFTYVLPSDGQPEWLLPLCTFLSLMLMVNIGLAIFNMIPIPPLDGSHVLETFMPDGIRDVYEQIKPYSFLILLALMWLGIFGLIISPVRKFVIQDLLWGM